MSLIAGVDEAGRGPLAGPVVAAAVVLAPGTRLPGLTDSKALAEADRLRLRELITARALAWAVGIVDVATIDRLNILQATFLAMHRALDGLLDSLPQPPSEIWVDGNRFRPYIHHGRAIPHRCIVRGDASVRAISAASVLAKTTRDALMAELHTQFPHYHWARNKGYPTPDHRAAIAAHGLCEHHRRSFRQLPDHRPQPRLFDAD